MKQQRGSIKQWARSVRARLERTRRLRPASARPPFRPDPRLEPLEPRILLSADVGLVADEALTAIALAPEVAAPRVEIHDEVLVREASHPEPTSDAADDQEAADAADTDSEVPRGAGTVGSEGTEASTGEGAGGGRATEADRSEQGDPGRADQVLAARLWSEQAAVAPHTTTRAPSQLVVIDGRVPEVESLLASLLESTDDLAAAPGDAASSQPDDALMPDATRTDDASANDRGTASSGDRLELAEHAASRSALSAADVLEARGVQVIVLDTGRDGLEQVSEILEAFQGVSALHLVSHGAAGALQLGEGRVTSESLQSRLRNLGGWGRSLSADADILLYGCNVADGEVGIEFVSALAAATGADVAASSDATGGDGYGDWDLEIHAGQIEAQALRAPGFAAALATQTVSGTAANERIVVSYDATAMQWAVSVDDPDDAAPPTVTTFASPADGGAGDPAVIRIDAGAGTDTIVIESVDAAFGGTLEVVGGDGDDRYEILADEWGAVSIVESANGGERDTLAFAAPGTDRSAAFTDQSSIAYADERVERIEGFALSTQAVEAGLDALVEWASALSSTGALGQQLAGIAGSADVGIGTAIDLGDVFDQLRQQIKAGIDANGGSLSAGELQDLLGQFMTAGVEHAGRAVVGDVLNPDVVAADDFVFELDLDGTTLTLGGAAAEDQLTGYASLDDLVTALEEKLGTSELSGRVRAVVIGTPGDELVPGRPGTLRLAFVADDGEARELSVTGRSTGAAKVGFTVDSALVVSELDAKLAGLGLLHVNQAVLDAGLTLGVGAQLDFVAGTPTLGFTFRVEAQRTSEFNIDLGEQADRLDLEFQQDATLDLSSIFAADLALTFTGEGAGQTFEMGISSPELSAQVLNGGADALPNIFDEATPITMNVGFLGAQIGPDAALPGSERGEIELHLVYQSPASWTGLDAATLRGEVEGTAAATLADRVGDLDAPVTDAFSVRLPVTVKPFLGLDATSDAFDGIAISTPAFGGAASALDGRTALGESDFQGFDQIENFAKLDPSSYISLLGQVRSSLDALRKSDLFERIDVPFVEGSIGKVADIADGFGDAILFDDGDDGIDSQNESVLVTRLNAALRDAGLDSLVQFRVTDVGAGTTKLQLVAVSPTVAGIKLSGASDELKFEDTVASSLKTLTSAVFGEAELAALKAGGVAFEIEVDLERDAPTRTETVTIATDVTTTLTKVGNDVAKLLDESNSATFGTAQELVAKLFDLALAGAIADTPIKWADQKLTFALDFDADLIDVELPVAFDLDLGPVGNIGTAADSTITIGGDVGFGLTLGLNLGELPGRAISNDTDLTELAGVDDLTDAVKLTPSITATREPGETVNQGEEDAAEIAIEETAMQDAGTVTFGTAQSIHVDAESLINGVMNLTSPANTVIQVKGPLDAAFVTSNGRTVPLRGVPAPSSVNAGEAPFTTQALTFELRIDSEDPNLPGSFIEGDVFTVSVSEKSYDVRTSNAAKLRFLDDVEKAIAAAQSKAFDATIARSQGSWISDGFAAGDRIRVGGSGANDGLYVIDRISADGAVLTLEDELAAQAEIDTTAAGSELEIVGPGRLVFADSAANAWPFAVGERIVLSGSESNDGTYVVTRVVDDAAGAPGNRAALVVDDFVDSEAASGELRVSANGAPVRVELSPGAEDATFDLEFTIEGIPQTVAVVVSRDGEMLDEDTGERVPGASSNLSDNRNLSDLASDVQNAIDDAVEKRVDELVAIALVGVTDEAERTALEAAIRARAPKVEVGLDGTRLVLTLANATQVTDGPLLGFTRSASEVVVTRSFGSGAAGDFREGSGDGFRVGQRVVVNGTSGYDGEYDVIGVSEIVLRLAARPGTTPSSVTEPQAPGIAITETFSLANPNATTSSVLGFESDRDASLADLVVVTADGVSKSVVLDGVTTVGQAITRINASLGGSATIALNDEKTGFDVTQTALFVGVVDEPFRIESVGASGASVRLGIGRADAQADENEDGVIDQRDGDGVITGAPVGGASLFDRFFIDDVKLELGLEMTAPGIEVTGDFGFFEIGATASGDITAVATLELGDPDPETFGITLRDLYEAFRDFDQLKKMLEPPSFGGATLDDDAGAITFADVGEEGRLTRTNGTWAGDRFKLDQKITVRDGAGVERIFQIVGISDKTLILDGQTSGLASGDAAAISVESAVATLTVKDLVLPGGIEQLAGLGDARVVLSVLDLGNPFFSEKLDESAGNPFASFTAKDVLLLGAAISLPGDPGDVEAGDTVEIEIEDANGALVMASAVIKSLGIKDGKQQITLESEPFESTDGVTVKKLVFTKPVEYQVDTPDFGNLLDFSNIGFEDILDGLLALSAFLDQFESFEFLNEDIPLVGVSFNDLLGYADQFRDMVNAAKQDPAGSFQSLESQLEALLGIDDGTLADGGRDPFDIELEFVTEARGEAGPDDDHMIAKLSFIVGAGFSETLGIEFDVGDAGLLAGGADLEASGDLKLVLALGIDLSVTRVHGDALLTFQHTDGAGGDTIRRSSGSFASDGFLVGQSIEIADAGEYSGRFEIAEISADGLTITLDDEFGTASTDAAEIAEAVLEGDRGISIYDETGISAGLNGRANDLSFRAAVGPLGVFILEDDPNVRAIDIGGNLERDTNGDGDIDGKDAKRLFDAGLGFTGDTQSGEGGTRKLIGEIGFDDFQIAFGAGIAATLPVAFPTDSLVQGRVDFDASLLLERAEDGGFRFDTTGPTLRAYDEAGVFLGTEGPGGEVTDSGVGQLFDLSALLDLGELSIFDNILLAVDGIDFFLGGLQDILDGEVFGIDLPLIGDSLSEGAGFIADLREGFLADFREGVEDAEDFLQDLTDPNENVISKLLFDVLSETGLLLVELEDGTLIKATQAGLAAGLFELSDAISLNGEEGDSTLPDPTASVNALTRWIKGQDEELGPPEIKWNMKLGQNLLDVDTDLDVDLGIPGLGFEADGPLGLKIGWDLDFGFGLNFEEGFFLDIAAEDGTDLEVNLDVTLPDRLAGQLAFLQLDAINDGSGLGATFVVDIFNANDPVPGGSGQSSEIDEKLSFTELGKLRLRAEMEAQALASFDMLLALNSDLIPNAKSVFPTIGADFMLDWSIGGHLGDAGQVQVAGTELTRESGTWDDDGFRVGQRIVVSGFTGDEAVNGEYFIAAIDGARLTLSGDAGGSDAQASGLTIVSFQDLSKIDGSVVKDGLNIVAFQNIELDLGSFISDLIAPILGQIQEVTAPLQPIIDIVTSPLPVISEFAGPVSLIDLAGIFGSVNPDFLHAVADIITLANSIPTEKGEVKIGFGDFTIYSRFDAKFDGVDLSDPNFDASTIEKPKPAADTFDKQLDAKEPAGGNQKANQQSKSFAQKLKGLEGFSFPFLADPSELFGLFTGEPVTLVGYDMPALDFEFQYTQLIPIYPPLFVGLGGSFGAHIDFAFGFDTKGLSQFADGGFRNPGLIFNGLFVSDNPTDVTGAGPDLPELTFTGSFTATAELNLGFARGGAGGGLFAEVFFDLFDPDHDGRVRILEIAENFENQLRFGDVPLLAPLAIFDVSGNVKARLFAFIEVDLLVVSFYKEFDIVPPITLVDFELEFQRAPKLASQLPDGVLQLNMGDAAGQRLNGNLADGDEHFIVEDVAGQPGKVRVRALGLGPIAEAGQIYDRPTAILALGGKGNDVIDLSGLSHDGIRLELEGGEGNDVLIGGTGNGRGVLKGGLGDDVIVGGGGDDVIHGDEGSDVIDGGAGDDVIFADGGRIVVGEARVTRIDLEVTPSFRQISRSDGVTWAEDGFKPGQTIAISGSTLAVDGATEGPGAGNNGFYEIVSVGATALTLRGPDGAPIALGFERTDELKIEIVGSEYRRSVQASSRASDGDDVVLGGLGSDSVFGAGGADLILGGGATIAGQTANGGMRGWASSVATAAGNGTAGRTARLLRDAFSADLVAENDGGTGSRDILVGDGGEIRYRLGETAPTLRDVVETNRGLFFGSDSVHGGAGDARIYAGQGDDFVHGGDGADLIFGESGLDELRGGAGADVIHGGRDNDLIIGGADGDELYGDEGSDVIAGQAGSDRIFGGSGSDWIWGGTGNDRVDAGGDFDTVYGGTGSDTLDGGAGDDRVFGDDGADVDLDGVPDDLPAALLAEAPDPLPVGETYNDILFVGAGSDVLDGDASGDEYIVAIRGAANDARIAIRDTGATGVDRLTVNGTDFDDLFLLRAIQYAEGNPTPEGERFEAFVASINRDGNLERIDQAGVDRVVVNGQQGDDEFAVDDVAGSTELNGGGGEDLFKVGQIYKTPRTLADANLAIGDYFDTIETTRGWLSNGISEAMVINAGADDDEIIVLRNLAVLQVNGEEGDDKITVRAFALTDAEVERQKALSAEELEALERDATEIVGGAGADLIQYAVNAPVNIDGGDGLDTVAVIGTEFADDFVITENGVYGAGLNVNLVNVELLTVDGAEGDDAFFVQSTQDGLITQLLGGLGSDTFDVAGDAPPVVSNDLLGHSGLITHGIESNDPRYLGADGQGIAVHGISANVADDDEPFARITLTDGATRIGEDGLTDRYAIALTRQPEEDEVVRIAVLAPSLTPEEKARGAQKFRVSSAFGEDPAPDGSSTTLVFTHQNWNVQQWVEITAIDDSALEGERFGVINHQVTTTLAGSRYDGLALPSVSVQIEDNDEADVLVFESDTFTRATEGDTGPLDQYEVQLSRRPAGSVDLRIDVTPPPGVTAQITVTSAAGTLDGSTLVLHFDATNWNVRQTVTVEAVDDEAREGFHRDFIQHTVTASTDADQVLVKVDDFTPADTDSEGLSIWPATSVLLDQLPIQQTGVIGSVSGRTFEIGYGTLEPDSLVGHAVRLSSGPADGQARLIVANDATSITLDRAFDVDDEALLEGSKFRTSNVRVTVDPAAMSGAPDVELLANGEIKRSAGSWRDDGFVKNQEIVVEDAAGELLGRYVIESVSVDALQVVRVGDDGGRQDAEVDSGVLSGVRVFVAPLGIDRFLVNSSTLVFLDENGRPETREASDVRVEYEFLQQGFDGRREERIAVEVVDDDTAGVLITQTGGSTDVTEGGTTPDTLDSYSVVLTRAPEFTGAGPAYVDVVVRPEITRTTRGSTAFEQVQVVVGSDSPGATQRGDEVVLRFTADDWDVPKIVTVAARQDAVVDGNDTQVFPEIPHTLAGIQGPLFIDGAGGQGSLEGLLKPVMLDGETSQRPSAGTVDGIEANALVVSRAALEAELQRRAQAAIERDGRLGTADYDPADYDELGDLVGRTVELIDVAGLGSGPGDGDFTLIVGVTDLGGDVIRLDLDPAWRLSADELAEIGERAGDPEPANRYGFAITDESATFFVVESEQVDVLRMNDQDNPADWDPAAGGASNASGRLTVFDPDAFPDTASLLTADADGFGQGQWGRITGLGMSPDSFIARAERPGGVTYGHLEGLQIDLGLGDNHFTIDAVHQRDDGVHTYTVVNAGDGDDTIVVSVARPEDPAAGLPFLRIDGGDGDDRIDASAPGLAPSTLPMEIFGSLGSDFIRGGDGDDLIYGDFGISAIGNVIDLDAELAARQLARRGPAPGAADAAVAPDSAAPASSADVALPERFAARVVPIVGTRLPDVGARDELHGMGGQDRMFGGADGDVMLGGSGDDVMIGDYGRVSDLTATRRLVETTDFFRGGRDGMVAGTGNDVLLGGFGGDALAGNFATDVIIGEYARLTLENGRAVSVVRLGQGSLDLAASSIFELYAPRPAPGGVSPLASEVARATPGAVDRRADAAEAVSTQRRINAGGGEAQRGRHRVREGDSLWSISERELGDPYAWPKVAELNQQLIDDPNVIEPDWVLRIPTTPGGDDAELRDADAVRARLAEIDARTQAPPGVWGFSIGGDDTALPQVGTGAPGEAEPGRTRPERPEPAEALPDQGAAEPASDGPSELLGAVWAGLMGWQTRVTRRSRRGRWLAFDAASGRYGHAQLDTEGRAAATHIRS